MEAIKVLDHGYVRFVEAWGHGDGGVPLRDYDGSDWDPIDYECGIIEAARQSTQGSFRGWEDKECPTCRGVKGFCHDPNRPGVVTEPCSDCNGKGILPGDQRLLAFLFNGKPQHATPFEFSGMVIEVQAPIFVFREWHRHRSQSYNEMSGRYAPLPDLNYVPTADRLLQVNEQKKNKQAGAVKGAEQLTESMANDFRLDLIELYNREEQFYQHWLGMGVAKELARIPIGVGRYSKMRASANLRNWLAFLTLRADPAAAWEIQQYAHAVGTIIAQQFPWTWNLYCKRDKA